MRALVVDDSRTARLILRRMLGKLGYQDILEAANGREALKVLAGERGIGLVVVDWNMPEMNGLELVRAIRRNPLWASVNVVMVTTETEIEQVAVALEAGANEYVMKPFTEQVLADKLRLIGAPC